MKVKFLNLIAILLAVSVSASEAKAASLYAGALLGVTQPTTNGGDSIRFGYGAEFGAKVTEQFGLGLSLTSSSESEDVGFGYSAKLRQTVLVVQGNYYFAGVEGLYAGVHAGPVFENVSVSAGRGTTLGAGETEIGAGAQVGYDAKVATNCTIGPVFKPTYVFGDKGYVLFDLFVSLKYWF